MPTTLSKQQALALRQIGQWYRMRSHPYLTLGGYAGTGKTTLIAYMRRALADFDPKAKVAFCAFTGKAADVLRQAVNAQSVLGAGDTISTVHSLIYNVRTDTGGHVSGWHRKTQLDFNLIVVDEASMLAEPIWRDLLAFGIPVLAVGDHGQLPPIDSKFHLMAEPHLRLEQVYRQEADSPVITVATEARQTGRVAVGRYGEGVEKLSRYESETGQAVEEMLQSWSQDLLVLCGYNRTRLQLNEAIRGFIGFDLPLPQPGDYAVCLRNNAKAGLYNGMTGFIRSLESLDDDWYEAEIELDGGSLFAGPIAKAQFGASENLHELKKTSDGRQGNLFDFGYALTVHKAQGSQAESVLLFEERFPKMDDDQWRRWLYTGITRARRRLTIVGT